MTGCDLNYSDFEEYLKSLGKATRKNLRRKFRKTESTAPITLEVVNDVTAQIDEIYPLYLQVHERSPLKFERLTKEYLCSLGQRMPERARFFHLAAERESHRVQVCMVHGGTIYDEYLGLDYRVAYDFISIFIRCATSSHGRWSRDSKNYCSSPLNYDPKLHLGCDLVPLDLYVTHTSTLLNPIFRRALKFLEPTRHDPVLRRFSNAHQLR